MTMKNVSMYAQQIEKNTQAKVFEFPKTPLEHIERELAKTAKTTTEFGSIWAQILKMVSFDWFMENIEAVKTVYQQKYQEFADQLFYHEQIEWSLTFSYTEELYKALQQQKETDVLTKHVSEDVVGVSRQGMRHIIFVRKSATLEELCGDKTEWKYAIDGKPGPNEVRSALRRQLKYLTSLKGFHELRFKGNYLSNSRKYKVGKLVARVMPMNYPSILQSKINRHKFFLDHPELASKKRRGDFEDIIWSMYRISGQPFLEYCHRAMDKQGEADEKHRQQQEEFRARRAAGQMAIPPLMSSSNVLHDALYGFTGMTHLLTKQAALQLLKMNGRRATHLLDSLRGLIHVWKVGERPEVDGPGGMNPNHGRNRAKRIPLKELRQRVKAIIMSDKPEDEIQRQMKVIENERAAKLIRQIGVNEEVRSGFFERVRKYSPNANLPQMVSLFGVKDTKTILRGKAVGLFEPEVFPMPLQFIGHEVRMALGDQKAGWAPKVQNPKRLFHKLSAIGNVNDMVKGHIADPKAVLDALTSMGYEFTALHGAPSHEQALGLRAVVEEKCSPEFLVAGDASVCCMRFGADNATTYAKHKGFGVLNIYLGDRIIANSVLWINKMPVGRALVLDNIEVHPNYTARFNWYIQELYEVVIDSLMRKYDCVVAVQGAKYNDLNLTPMSHPMQTLFKWKFDPVDVGLESFYSDASQGVKVVGLNQTTSEIDEWVQAVQSVLPAWNEARRNKIKAGRIDNDDMAWIAGDAEPVEWTTEDMEEDVDAMVMYF